MLSAASGVLSACGGLELRPLRAATEKARNEEFCARYDATVQAFDAA